MAIRIKVPSIKPQVDETVKHLKQRIEQTVASSTEQMADDILEAGRSDIAAAGRFGGKWISGFTYEMSGEGNARTIVFHHSNPLWRVFQSGATIVGTPLLWIPVEPGAALALSGRLFQVKRGKKRDVPLLMSADDKRVKYIGVKKVRIRRNFTCSDQS